MRSEVANMNVSNPSRGVQLATAMLLGAMAMGSLAQPSSLPEGSYACQVITERGGSGLVMVQTDSAAEASRAAAGGLARIGNGKQERAAEVQQCIRLPDGSFRDRDFQAFFESFGE